MISPALWATALGPFATIRILLPGFGRKPGLLNGKGVNLYALFLLVSDNNEVKELRAGLHHEHLSDQILIPSGNYCSSSPCR